MQENIIKISSLINKRFDPFFYRNEFLINEKRLALSQYDIKNIQELSKFVVDGIHKTPSYATSGPLFLQAGNISEGEINLTQKVKYLSEESQKEAFDRYVAQDGDVLITKDGTIGISAAIKDLKTPTTIFVSVAAIRPKIDIISPDFLSICLNSSFVQKQIKRVQRGAVLVHLLLEDIRKLKIVLPPIDIQINASYIVKKAYNNKKKNEIKIQEYLNSIDDYILKKLGIKLPNKDMKKIFTSNISSFVGNRYDPAYNQPYYAELVESFSNKNGFKLCCLSDLISTQTVNTSQYDFINYIDLGSIDDQLNSIQYKMVEKENIPSRAKMHVAKGDFIFSGLAGSISSIAIIDKQLDNMVASTGFYVIKPSEEYNTEYLFALFKTKFMQTLLIRYTSGAVMPAINAQELKNIFIPLPPLKIQEEIALTVKQIIRNAKSLEIEANQNLFLAKQEFENILLGA